MERPGIAMDGMLAGTVWATLEGATAGALVMLVVMDGNWGWALVGVPLGAVVGAGAGRWWLGRAQGDDSE